MNLFVAATMGNFKVTKDYRKSLIELLYTEALDGGLFDESDALLGIGLFEDSFQTERESFSYYCFFVNVFENLTGKRIFGSIESEIVPEEEIAPDPTLSEEEYHDELMAVVYKARPAIESILLHDPGSDAYKAKLKYREVLAYNVGANAWLRWLEEVASELGTKEHRAFIDEAMEYYHNEFFGTIQCIREDDEVLEEFEAELEELEEE